MKHREIRRSLRLVGFLCFVLLVAGGISASFPNNRQLLVPQVAHASADLGQISGNAWSDTIGWISFDNSLVSVASDGTLSGYAWSDHIGWVSFSVADLTGCPSGTCPAQIVGTALQGWAKATATDGNGWDGWISLSNTGVTLAGGTSVTGPFSGYGWGSEVVGWVDFSGVNFVRAAPPPPTTLTLTANPPKVRAGATTQLSWTSPGDLVGPCTMTRSPTNGSYPQTGIPTGATSGGPVATDAITQNTTFTLTCGTVSGNTTVGTVPVYKEI